MSEDLSLQRVSTIIFGAISLWSIRKIRSDRHRGANSGQISRSHCDNVATSEDHGSNVLAISSRSRHVLSPAAPYFSSFFRGLDYPCTPQSLDGFILLCVAENKLAIEILSNRLQNQSTQISAFADPVVFCYNSFLGLPVARQSIAYFLAKRFLHTESAKARSSHPLQKHKTGVSLEKALQSINPAHIGIGSGAAGILNALFFLLGDEGDVCLIPAPYYAAFENDMRTIARVVPFAVHLANPTTGPSASDLDIAYTQAKSQGLNPKFLLITNPNNPLGIIYNSTIMLDAVTWARKRQLHTIVDEIYALSTHRKHGHGFESIIKILNNQLGFDVHFVWSVSKDFGASGLRFGVVYSQNEIFLDALANFNVFSGVSNPMQMVVSELLTDDNFVDRYLDESRDLLCRSYSICIRKLEEMVLPFIPAAAGQFVYVDFSSLLPGKTMEWEQRLSQLLVDHARLVLTPGESQRERMPGMFRICYAWVTPEVLEIGMERLSRIVAKIRRMDWSDLNESTLSGVL